MTVEEAIQKANDGDVEVMLQLGNHYAENRDYDNALIWYRKAAQEGNLNGVYRTFLTDNLMLTTSVIVSPDEEDDTYFHEIEQCASILKRYSSVDLEPNYSNSKYSYAESLYRREKFSTLFELVQNEQQARFRVMHALVLFSAAASLPDDQKEDYYRNAVQVIQAVLESGYIPEKHHNEQVRFIEALGTYTAILRIGLFSKPDIPASYHVLTSQRDKLTDEDAVSFLSDLLSHYQVKKGLFGTTITYID